MVFSSLVFIFFFLPAALLIYYLFPPRWRNAPLLALSLLFYGWGEPKYIVLMLLSTAVDFFCGGQVERYIDDRRCARRYVALSAVFNLSMLGFFKYLGPLSAALGLPFSAPPLPVGISFYTFQTMSYTIDIYRRQALPQKSILPFSVYVTLFPQLIAGPIVRYQELAGQLKSRVYTADGFAAGASRFCVGLAKKVLLANNAGLMWDELRMADSTAGAWLGAAAFGLQLYFDFSGYSDMAIGLGRLLGFSLPENFNYPYLSKSAAEFWRRWHITLGAWFREYLYIPLGGSRVGPARWALNMAAVWAATGLWHGAGLNFLAWGLYFGALIIIERLFLSRLLERLPDFFSHLYLLAAVAVGWVFFSLEDMSAALAYLRLMLGGGAAWSAGVGFLLRENAVLLAALVIGSTPLPKALFDRLGDRGRLAAATVLCLLSLTLSTAYLVSSSYNPFLYFRF